MDDDRPATAKQLILKALLFRAEVGRLEADRVKATQVMTSLESIKEILAEKDKQGKIPGRRGTPHRGRKIRGAEHVDARDLPIRAGPAVAAGKRISCLARKNSVP